MEYGIGQSSTKMLTLEELHKLLDQALGNIDGYVAVVTEVKYGDYKEMKKVQSITLAGRLKI